MDRLHELAAKAAAFADLLDQNRPLFSDAVCKGSLRFPGVPQMSQLIRQAFTRAFARSKNRSKVTPESSGKQKRFDDRTNFNREFCGATKKPLETPSEFTRAGLYYLLGRITGI
jgi:hypothetical protein